MLGTAGLIVCYLWWRLGGSSEYRGPSPDQAEQLHVQKDAVESLAGRRSIDSRPPAAELFDDQDRR